MTFPNPYESPRRSTFKVIYHDKDQITIKTKVKSGTLSLMDDFFEVAGPTKISIPFAALRRVEIFRLYGTGRMIRVAHTEGTLVLSVVRLNILNLFVIVNFLATGELAEYLTAHVPDAVP